MEKNQTPQILGVDTECPACKKLKQQSGHISVSRVIEKLDSLLSKNDLGAAERLLDYWITEAETLGDLSGELSLVNEWLGLSRRTKNEKKAKEMIARAHELIDARGIGNHISGATILLNAATTENAFGAPEKAAVLYARASEIYKAEGLDENDPRYAALYNNYAATLVELSRFDEAKTLYEKALELSEKAENLPDCAITYVNMAHLYEHQDGIESEKITDCLVHAERLLEECEKNSYYAFVAEKCAPSFDYYGYFMTAKNLRERSREIYERS